MIATASELLLQSAEPFDKACMLVREMEQEIVRLRALLRAAGVPHRKVRSDKCTQREEARAAGQAKYLGKPCTHGHGGMRYTSTGGCVECRCDYAAQRGGNRAALLRDTSRLTG